MVLAPAQAKAQLKKKLLDQKALMAKRVAALEAGRRVEADLPERSAITQRALGGTVAAQKNAILGQNQAPAVREGEDPLGSRGYCFYKAAGLAAGTLLPEDCKLEWDISNLLRKEFSQRNVKGYIPANSRDGVDFTGGHKSVLSPLGAEMLYSPNDTHSSISKELAYSMKSMLARPIDYDPEEAQWLVQKGWADPQLVAQTNKSFTQKVGGSTQSFLQENLGGALVPFPEFGPLVPLLRSTSAVLRSGAQVFPLPPSGRITFPRQTTPITAYNVGEGINITQSSVGTGQIEIAAKKIGAYLVTNNELLRFGGPIVEQLFRNDMMISISLLFDQNLMIGQGSDNVTQGLVGYSGVQAFTATGGSNSGNGYNLAPGDIYTMIGNVFAANATFEGWLIYPTLIYSMYAKRSSVLSGGDNLGLFLFDLTRVMGDSGAPIEMLGGYKAIISANVPNGRTMGTLTTGTVLFGGQWTNMRVGMFGSIEFAMANQGSVFQADQTAVRAIMSADGAPLNPGAFIYSDNLIQTVIGN